MTWQSHLENFYKIIKGWDTHALNKRGLRKTYHYSSFSLDGRRWGWGCKLRFKSRLIALKLGIEGYIEYPPHLNPLPPGKKKMKRVIMEIWRDIFIFFTISTVAAW